MINKDWNRQIVSGIVTHFYNGLNDNGIKAFYEGQDRDTNTVKEWAEIRLTEIYWEQIDARTWVAELAVNILCSAPSGEDATDTAHDVYRIEDMLGICQSLFTVIRVDGLPCLVPGASTGRDIEQFRPRQVDTATNLVQASVTGYYRLSIVM